MMDIYPLTVFKDRYTGTYSGGEYVAFNLDPYEVPREVQGEDTECFIFWSRNTIPVGVGNTIDEAISKLKLEVNDDA